MKSSRMRRDDLEPAIVRNVPVLSRRRTAALRGLRDLLRHDVTDLAFDRRHALRPAVVQMSSRTIELLVERFASRGVDALDFIAALSRFDESDLETRALLSYWDVMTALHLNEVLLGTRGVTPMEVRIGVQRAFTAAQSQHPEFMTNDVAALTGDSRDKFTALLTLFASTLTGADRYVAMIPRDITDLAMSRPERAFSIVEFQRSLGMPFEDLDATLVETYLDNPSPALSSGLL